MSPLLRNILSAVVLAWITQPSALDAQLRRVVSKSVSASPASAALELSFSDDGVFELRLDRGTVFLDDEPLGPYRVGAELDRAWRALLSEAMTLENGALAERLAAWSPPAEIDGSDEALGRSIDQALKRAVETSVVLETESQDRSASMAQERRLVEVLVGSVRRLGALEEALEGLPGDYRIFVGEDFVIPEGTVVDQTLVMIDGTLRVEGEIGGDVVVVDGALEVSDSGVIRGQARIADARVLRNTGEIEGGIVDVLEEERDLEAELRDRLREEIRAEVRRDLRNEMRNEARMGSDDSFSIMSPVRPVIRAVGGVLEKLILVFVLGLVGAGFIAFAGENMDNIAETARRAPGRAAVVGFAGSFLLIPVWLLGLVALLVSIIGIPVAIAWAPLFPLAAALAFLLGYLAVARTAGEWLADSGLPWTGWIRKTNPIFTLVGGLLALCLAFMVGHLVSIIPFLGFFGGLLIALGVIVTILAFQIGFGSVLLTRGGRRREYQGAYDPDAAWEAAMSVDVDEDVGPGPTGGQDAHDA
ncbi:MAG: hypothetical protein OEN56_11265 [Gemmatimonadota bacterium]|nr:hypothetical protein [Gemmatimonadota bacterium]